MKPVRPHFVLLPGLDGTGHYSRLLARALEPDGDVTLLAYPRDEPLGYDELVPYVEARLPRTRHVLVAESFSGPLALRIARRPPAALVALALASTFATLCWPMKRALLAAAQRMTPRDLPPRLNSAMAWGPRGSIARRNEMAEVMGQVRTDVVARRTRELLRVDERAGPKIRLPALVIRGRHDRIVGLRSSATLDTVLEDIERIVLDAPHFVLQAEPDAAAARIVDFARRRAYSGS